MLKKVNWTKFVLDLNLGLAPALLFGGIALLLNGYEAGWIALIASLPLIIVMGWWLIMIYLGVSAMKVANNLGLPKLIQSILPGAGATIPENKN